MQQTHRQGGGMGAGANSLVPVSPSAVTNADRQTAQSTSSSLVAQSPAITATTLISQSSAAPVPPPPPPPAPRAATSSQQQIQTAPPPVAGGHQYHQLVSCVSDFLTSEGGVTRRVWLGLVALLVFVIVFHFEEVVIYERCKWPICI